MKKIARNLQYKTLITVFAVMNPFHSSYPGQDGMGIPFMLSHNGTLCHTFRICELRARKNKASSTCICTASIHCSSTSTAKVAPNISSHSANYPSTPHPRHKSWSSWRNSSAWFLTHPFRNNFCTHYDKTHNFHAVLHALRHPCAGSIPFALTAFQPGASPEQRK